MAGRLLTYQDISPALVGKRGELFWPDDNLWYLVEIHTVDLENRKVGGAVMCTRGGRAHCCCWGMLVGQVGGSWRFSSERT